MKKQTCTRLDFRNSTPTKKLSQLKLIKCDEEEDQKESPFEEKLVRGVNWAPDLCGEEEEDVIALACCSLCTFLFMEQH